MLVVDPSGRALRRIAVDRLATLNQAGDLTSEHVRLITQALGVTERTVWRWVRAHRMPPPPPKKRDRFRIDADLRVRLAYWRGNASALHRELLEQEKQGGAPAPSLATLHRAIR